jgi:hypothetical protein
MSLCGLKGEKYKTDGEEQMSKNSRRLDASVTSVF